MTCINCDGLGRIWHAINGLSTSLCLLPCECREPANSHLDTRPQERAERARGRWADRVMEITLRSWYLDHGGSVTVEEVEALLDRSNRDRGWQLAWVQAEVGR